VIAAELAIALAMHLDPILKASSGEEDGRLAELFSKKRKIGNTLFGGGSNLFSKGKRRLF
jgi:hypothetical protein